MKVGRQHKGVKDVKQKHEGGGPYSVVVVTLSKSKESLRRIYSLM